MHLNRFNHIIFYESVECSILVPETSITTNSRSNKVRIYYRSPSDKVYCRSVCYFLMESTLPTTYWILGIITGWPPCSNRIRFFWNLTQFMGYHYTIQTYIGQDWSIKSWFWEGLHWKSTRKIKKDPLIIIL